MSGYRTKSSRIVYENPWMIVHEDKVVMPNGQDGMYGYVESKSDSVFVVPVDEENNTYIVQQKRYTTKQLSWEAVAGRADGEPYEQAAARELLEEAGVKANNVQVLSEVYLAAGMSTFKGAVCLATDLEKATDKLDEVDGILAAHKLPMSEVEKMILNGEIINGPSITAFLMVASYLRKQGRL